ncbi:hypothetical protein [Marinobacter nauticus]|uniref:hypothetical protein n=1 Tax=Marinobacter nauticus TaxID=2743 RepID=UPI0040442A55
MSKKIYVHIGAHKSASTTIQQNLAFNKDKLKDSGVAYISPSEIAKSALGRHFRSISIGELDQEDSYLRSLSAARESMIKLLSQHQEPNVVFSWEGFLGHSGLDLYNGFYTKIDVVSKSIKYIFGDYFFRILLVVRRQDDFIESCYLQQIKEQRSIDFVSFVDEIKPSKISWLYIAEILSNSVGRDNFSVIPFEAIKTLGTKKFIEKCLNLLLGGGNVGSDFICKESSNHSISAEGVDIALKALPLIADPSEKKSFIRFVFSTFSSSKYGRARYFDSFNKRLMLKYCRDDNVTLFNRYILSDLDHDDCFGSSCLGYYVRDIGF